MNALLTVVILTAIPAVSFMLWADYFDRYFRMDDSELKELPKEHLLQRIRIAGAMSTICQLLIFFLSAPIRRESPLLTSSLFLGAILLQAHQQFKLERLVRPSEASGKDHLKLMLRAIAGCVLGGGLFMITVLAFAVLARFASDLAGLPAEAAPALTLAGATLGVIAGLFANFAFSPVFVSLMFPTSKLRTQLREDADVERAAHECFEGAGLPVPRVRVLEIDRFRAANVLVSGFAFRAGPLRPSAFITRNVIETLTDIELRAVLLHEASHLKLRHLPKRLMLCSSWVGASFLLYAAIAYFGPTLAVALWPVPLLGFFIGLTRVKKQSQAQEYEADLHAVSSLGASSEAMVNALRKLELFNGNPGAQASSSTRVGTGTHPPTERRIEALRALRPLHEAKPKTASDRHAA